MIGAGIGISKVLETNQQQSGPGLLLTLLTASLYLIVRGLDNVHHGLKAGNDPWATTAWELLSKHCASVKRSLKRLLRLEQ